MSGPPLSASLGKAGNVSFLSRKMKVFLSAITVVCGAVFAYAYPKGDISVSEKFPFESVLSSRSAPPENPFAPLFPDSEDPGWLRESGLPGNVNSEKADSKNEKHRLPPIAIESLLEKKAHSEHLRSDSGETDQIAENPPSGAVFSQPEKPYAENADYTKSDPAEPYGKFVPPSFADSQREKSDSVKNGTLNSSPRATPPLKSSEKAELLSKIDDSKFKQVPIPTSDLPKWYSEFDKTPPLSDSKPPMLMKNADIVRVPPTSTLTTVRKPAQNTNTSENSRSPGIPRESMRSPAGSTFKSEDSSGTPEGIVPRIRSKDFFTGLSGSDPEVPPKPRVFLRTYSIQKKNYVESGVQNTDLHVPPAIPADQLISGARGKTQEEE